MIFSVNQTRQLYVANSKGTVGANSVAGTIERVVTPDNELFFKYMGAGGQTRSDLIDIKHVLYATHTPASKLHPRYAETTVTLDTDINGGNPISGQDYILRLVFKNYRSLSPEDQYVKFGAVHAVANMSASKFYATLGVSLAKNFSKEEIQLVEFVLTEAGQETIVKASDKADDLSAEHTFDGLKIREIEQPWILGVKAQEPAYFEVIPTTVTFNGDEVIWGKATPISYVTPAEAVNGKLIADMEYFFMGERGDQYRNVGWPYVIPTTYLADPSKDYDVLEIHYAYVGSNESVQKSEKDITIVGEASVIKALCKELKSNITIKDIEAHN